jgi:hypothetical protein
MVTGAPGSKNSGDVDRQTDKCVIVEPASVIKF